MNSVGEDRASRFAWNSSEMEGLEGLPNWKVTRIVHEHEYNQPSLFFPSFNQHELCNMASCLWCHSNRYFRNRLGLKELWNHFLPHIYPLLMQTKCSVKNSNVKTILHRIRALICSSWIVDLVS